MNIPTIYILFSAEFFVILIAVGIFIFLRRRKLKNEEIKEEPESEEETTVEIGNSYIDFIDQEILKQNELSFKEPLTDEENEPDPDKDESEPDDNEDTDDEETEAIDDRTKLLGIRSRFLNIEKEAAEITEDDDAFWEKIVSGMQEISDDLTTIEEIPVETEQEEEEKPKSDEDKVLYIETQGKKIDGEVNKLKDIISGQEHTLNDLQKALKNAEENLGEGSDFQDSEEFQELKTQTNNFERQISDSKMCMEVLEMENNRLQVEVDDLQGRYNELFKKQEEADNEQATEISENNENIDNMKTTLDKQEQQITELSSTIDKLELSSQEADTLKDKLSEFARNSQEMMGCIAILEDENESLNKKINALEEKSSDTENTETSNAQENLGQMQEVLDQQEKKINELLSAIDELQLSAEQTEKLKSTIQDFARSSQEMMGCITILEEENDNLQKSISNTESTPDEPTTPEAAPASDEKLNNLKTKIKSYEKEIIKKDVAYAKLQDELSTIEKEYQAIYEQLHG